MKILNALVPLALLTSLAAPAGAQPPATTPTITAPAADVIGTWDATVTPSDGQAIPAQLKLKRDGDKIVGTISAHMGDMPVEAAVKAKVLTVWFTFQGQNGPMAIELAGTVEGDTVNGTMAAGGQPGGSWSATRGKESKDLAKDPKDPSTASSAAIPSLTGEWSVTVQLPNMTASPTLVLKQEGEKLTGDYVSAQYGKFPITGTIKGADVSLLFAMNVDGNALNVTYTGAADKDGSIKGTANYGDMMSGTFVASKKK
jgi:hypothetical protein